MANKRQRRTGGPHFSPSGTLPRTTFDRLGHLDENRGMGRSPMQSQEVDDLVEPFRSSPQLWYPSPSAKQPANFRRYSPWRLLKVAVPARVRFCVQRKERKEVLFAKKVAGRKGSAPGPYRRTKKSQWRC